MTQSERAARGASLRWRIGLVSVFLAAAVLRAGWPEVTWFGMDQTRDVNHARAILSGHLIATGPSIGLTGIPLGPLHYYVTALGLMLRDDPVDAIVLLALLNAAGVVGYVILFGRLLGRGAALAAGLVLALHPLAVLHARALWNPALILPTTALFLTGLWSWAEERRPRGALVMLLGAALMLQAHATTVLLLPLVLRGVVRRAPIRGLAPAAGAGLFVALTAPWLVAAVGELIARTEGLGDLERLSSLHARAGPATTPYGLGVWRALTVETVITSRALFGGTGWNRLAEIAGYAFSTLVLLGGVAAARTGASGRRTLWWLVPALLLPCLVLPAMRHFAYYYYLEVTWPMRAGLAVVGVGWLARRGARGGGLILAATVAVGVIHLVGGVARDRDAGLVRGRSCGIDLRAQRSEASPPNLFPTLGSKRIVGRALARELGCEARTLVSLGRGPWWAGFLDDGGFWIPPVPANAARSDGKHLLFIGHRDDPFPRPAAARPGSEVRAGAFRMVLFAGGAEAGTLQACLDEPGRGSVWFPLPADLGAFRKAPGEICWPAAMVRVRATFEVPAGDARARTVYVVAYYGATPAERVSVGEEVLALGHAWDRLGVSVRTYEWNRPVGGQHAVEVAIRSPSDRRTPVRFEVFVGAGADGG
ncbi:MAG: glycosyltransferase family 39 protein [Planctomycetes bacterium]|nr:glycosyltransferase family 39 protein [Planctomycetota bacterium]